MDVQMPEMGGVEATARSASARPRPAAHRDHRDDGARHDGRPGALPRRRHGRLPVEADRPECDCLPPSNSASDSTTLAVRAPVAGRSAARRGRDAPPPRQRRAGCRRGAGVSRRLSSEGGADQDRRGGARSGGDPHRGAHVEGRRRPTSSPARCSTASIALESMAADDGFDPIVADAAVVQLEAESARLAAAIRDGLLAPAPGIEA